MTARSLLLVAASGCNQAFGIDPTVRADGWVPDEDGDGVADAADNCVAIANDQSDEDDDGLGDACDNCPLVSNATQDRIGDDDPVGDKCDPRPQTAGDCLVLVDAFGDPARFDAHWQVHREATAPTIIGQPGHVVLAPPGAERVAIVARGADGNALAGVFDVQVLARVVVTTGDATAVSNASSARTGFGCAVQYNTALGIVEPYASSNAASAGSAVRSAFSVEPVGGDTLLRLVSPSPPAGETTVRCRVDYGGAFGLISLMPGANQIPSGGGPGFRAHVDPAEVSAVAIYQFQPGTACPQPIIR